MSLPGFRFNDPTACTAPLRRIREIIVGGLSLGVLVAACTTRDAAAQRLPSLCGGAGEKPCLVGGCDEFDGTTPLVERNGRCVHKERPIAAPPKAGKLPTEDEVRQAVAEQFPGGMDGLLTELGELAGILNGSQVCPRGHRQSRNGQALAPQDLERIETILVRESRLLRGLGTDTDAAVRAIRATENPRQSLADLKGVADFIESLECVPMGPAIEPDCDCDVAPAPTAMGEPLHGFADLHAHPFSNLAFGGLVLWGEAYHPRGIQAALPMCDFSGELDDDWSFLRAVIAAADGNSDPLLASPITRAFLGTPVHGAAGAQDFFGRQTLDEAFDREGLDTHPDLPAGQGVGGAGWMSAWPSWRSVTHQQMYYRWLERAWRGGLRLIVVHAVNNAVLCSAYPRREGNDCSDMQAVRRQLDAARGLEATIDREHGAGQGWFRIVESAAEARRVVREGKLAVVLGVEVDSLFECHSGTCNPSDVAQGLRALHESGVRHVIPIHLFDNDFGGAAVYKPKLATLNWLLSLPWGFAKQSIYPGGDRARLSMMRTRDCPGEIGEAARCNALGLTPLGGYLVEQMMKKGMVIDLDHMSAAAKGDTLAMADRYDYPVVSGHSELTSSVIETKRSERALTETEVKRIMALGGVVSAKMLPLPASQVEDLDGFPVEDNCDYSSRNWAQSYMRLVRLQGGTSRASVALGSDFNGMIAHAAPRFGDEACGGGLGNTREPQSRKITYPFTAHVDDGTFDRSRTGARTFDYNTDGLAHVGLLPDFVEDLKAVGLTDQDLAPLFRSAEAYIEMWERAEVRAESMANVLGTE